MAAVHDSSNRVGLWIETVGYRGVMDVLPSRGGLNAPLPVPAVSHIPFMKQMRVFA